MHKFSQQTLEIAREFIDKFLQGAIRLVMLTGVAFTVTACYGTPPEYRYNKYPQDPETQQPADNQQSDADASDLVDKLLATE